VVGADVWVTLTLNVVSDSVDTCEYTDCVLASQVGDVVAVFTAVFSCEADLPLPESTAKLTTSDPTTRLRMSMYCVATPSRPARSDVMDVISAAFFTGSDSTALQLLPLMRNVATRSASCDGDRVGLLVAAGSRLPAAHTVGARVATEHVAEFVPVLFNAPHTRFEQEAYSVDWFNAGAATAAN